MHTILRTAHAVEYKYQKQSLFQLLKISNCVNYSQRELVRTFSTLTISSHATSFKTKKEEHTRTMVTRTIVRFENRLNKNVFIHTYTKPIFRSLSFPGIIIIISVTKWIPNKLWKTNNLREKFDFAECKITRIIFSIDVSMHIKYFIHIMIQRRLSGCSTTSKIWRVILHYAE